MSPADNKSEDAGDRAYRLLSLSEKTTIGIPTLIRYVINCTLPSSFPGLILFMLINIPVWSLLSVSCGLAPLFRSISTVMESPSNDAYINAVLKNKPSQEMSTMYISLETVQSYFTISSQEIFDANFQSLSWYK